MRQDARVRPARLADLPLLPAIERSAAARFASQPELAHLAEGAVIAADEHAQFLSDGCLWVAESERAIGGFLAATDLAGSFHIREVSVALDAQGQGLGRALIETALCIAQERGFAAATLTTFRNVPWNAPFYARLGFRAIEQAELTPELVAILAKELAHGMPEGSRCAMFYPLG